MDGSGGRVGPIPCGGGGPTKGARGVVGAGVGGCLDATSPVGQHLVSTPPAQKPVLTPPPTHASLRMSMHTPGCPRRHAYGRSAGGAGGAVVAGDAVACLAPFCPLGQHRMLAAPVQ